MDRDTIRKMRQEMRAEMDSLRKRLTTLEQTGELDRTVAWQLGQEYATGVMEIYLRRG